MDDWAELESDIFRESVTDSRIAVWVAVSRTTGRGRHDTYTYSRLARSAFLRMSTPWFYQQTYVLCLGIFQRLFGWHTRLVFPPLASSPHPSNSAVIHSIPICCFTNTAQNLHRTVTTHDNSQMLLRVIPLILQQQPKRTPGARHHHHHGTLLWIIPQHG